MATRLPDRTQGYTWLHQTTIARVVVTIAGPCGRNLTTSQCMQTSPAGSPLIPAPGLAPVPAPGLSPVPAPVPAPGPALAASCQVRPPAYFEPSFAHTVLLCIHCVHTKSVSVFLCRMERYLMTRGVYVAKIYFLQTFKHMQAHASTAPTAASSSHSYLALQARPLPTGCDPSW